MITSENISLLIQIATLGGIVFGVFLFFRKPQEKSEVVDAVFQERFTQFDRELANLRDNHIHTIGVKLDDHIKESNFVSLANAEKMGRMEAKIDVLIGK